MHDVHPSDDGSYIVFAQLFEQGTANDEFTFLEQFLPVRKGQTTPVGQAHRFGEGTADDEEFFYYEGSLTTPPCTERVEWVILRTPATASEEQIARLTALMPEDNFRDVQPLNGRTVASGKIGQAL
jgi:carbonic anhydrase